MQQTAALPLMLIGLAAFASDYRAGVSRVDITPQGPILMAGYGSRNKPSEGVLAPLWAKALALEDRRGTGVVIVTTDLIGLPRSITDVIGARVEKEYGLERSRLLLNSSHTHTGPLIRGNLDLMLSADADQQAKVTEYTRNLTDQLFQLIGSALANRQSASVSYGSGSASFAINRREKTPTGIKIGLNPSGPIDHSVPVLKITGSDGKVLAVLFGYACHNTTLTGEHYKISGDYAGFAQAEIEKSVPGAAAMFMQLCAGDQNPNPRREESMAMEHGRSLAAGVNRALSGKLETVKGHIDSTLQWKDLPVKHRTRDDFQGMMAGTDEVQARFAKAMLKRYDEGRPMHSVSYPVQAIRLGDNFVLVALGGETVVGYDLQLKAAHPKLRLIVAGYSNDVMGYIPTAKMLDEGGYEPVQSTVYYGQAAPFAPEIEKIILDAASAAIRRVKP